ncbi:type IV pilin-like G/H family protein [Dolichospermum flos-aquae]|uniref:Prepilin-type N-terminal cleavage/methylation domain-containing protein n=1 Tax=Dolichospermum flos-aquae CCAP 1403/13F TaxID=315271 RepID=A0A6H2C006_DOLFA|nr:type IV pilin-like G/H family protein [Dolichospermum flos-aquae]QJB44309.1 prepilin-type N-terminal cleavage/methylation domain-containing protein [Dolichospermum flos-aquae CCAP 1403/13F]
MKTELKAKFIQQILSKKKDSEGFTLIELLVVIIIIGILSAIALPSFLSQAGKARQAEAKSFVGAVNRAQQSYRMENTQFAAATASLQINVPTTVATDTSGNFYYYYNITDNGATNTTFTARPVNNESNSLRAYAGGVVILGGNNNGLTDTVACMTTAPTGAAPTLTLNTTAASCATPNINMK